MNFEALDDPALVVPRVLDVHGTLLRLGFKGFTIRRGTDSFYRLFVPLFHNIQPPIHNRNRQISHVEFIVYVSEDVTVRIFASYGYPERYKKKLKIIESFQKLLSETTSAHVSLNHHDERLRELEQSLSVLITNLKTKRVDCVVDRDSETGVIKSTIPEHEALVSAVQQTMTSMRARDEQEWFISDPGEPEPTDSDLRRRFRSVIGLKHSRLPNFDRRRVIRANVRRPV